jgi:hypothetical protein
MDSPLELYQIAIPRRGLQSTWSRHQKPKKQKQKKTKNKRKK